MCSSLCVYATLEEGNLCCILRQDRKINTHTFSLPTIETNSVSISEQTLEGLPLKTHYFCTAQQCTYCKLHPFIFLPNTRLSLEHFCSAQGKVFRQHFHLARATLTFHTCLLLAEHFSLQDDDLPVSQMAVWFIVSVGLMETPGNLDQAWLPCGNWPDPLDRPAFVLQAKFDK